MPAKKTDSTKKPAAKKSSPATAKKPVKKAVTPAKKAPEPAVKKTAAPTKKKAEPASKKAVAKKAEPAVKKTAAPVTKAGTKARAGKKQAASTEKGDRLYCTVCGIVITVEEECGCEVCDIICCDEPMQAKR